MTYLKSYNNIKNICADSLKKGNVIIVPTDTVYGFSGIVDDKYNTAEIIRNIKGRSESKSFIQLIANPEDIKKYTNDFIPQKLLSLWPGPLTIIVNSSKSNETIAFRCPGDKWIRDIIQETGKPIFSTSVNRSGEMILDTESSIINEFEKSVDFIVLDGNKKNSLPSTIIKLIDNKWTVMRQGAVIIED